METVKEKSRAGTVLDVSSLVGRLKETLTGLRIRVPTLNFSFTRTVRNYWSACWGGHCLPFRLTINGEMDKETYVGRLAFATTFIIADSVYLVGKSGAWFLKKMPWNLNMLNMLMLAGCIVGFLGWGLPWFLTETGAMEQIGQTKTIRTINSLIGSALTLVPAIELSVIGWIGLPFLIGWIVAVPCSVFRLKKWRGIKNVFKRKWGGAHYEN